MGRKYQIQDQDSFYFVTFTVIKWIDVFIRDEYRSIFLESVKYCQLEKGLLVGAWCMMTSHVYMILSVKSHNKLGAVIRDLKSYTSRHIRKFIQHSPQESRKEWILWMMERAGESKSNNKDFQFWQQHNHPIELTSNSLLDQKLEYIHQNPVQAGFVNNASDWLYSSARDYEGTKGLIEIYYLD